MTIKIVSAMILVLGPRLPAAQPPQAALTPLLRAVDLNVGESMMVELADGKKVAVKLRDLREARDQLRNAVRRAEVSVEVNSQRVTLVSANYRQPTTVAAVQIDSAAKRLGDRIIDS